MTLPFLFERGRGQLVCANGYLHEERGLGLLSVVFLLVILSASVGTAFVMLQPAASGTAAARTSVRLAALGTAITDYRSYAGSAPPSLDALVNAPAGMSCIADAAPSSATFRQLRGWCGPYIDPGLQDAFKRDGWGGVIQFNGTALTSCGPNRICGDGDDISISP